jgi:alginate O-acetyltransferase complex protein AlgI
MLFNSLTFVVFFVVVLALYRVLPSWPAKKVLLLAASYVFYGAWNPPFVLLLVSSTVIDFWAARRMAETESPRLRKGFLMVSLVGNLGLLGFFKYGEFLLENFVALMNAMGVQWQPATPDIILPVGN